MLEQGRNKLELMVQNKIGLERNMQVLVEQHNLELHMLVSLFLSASFLLT